MKRKFWGMVLIGVLSCTLMVGSSYAEERSVQEDGMTAYENLMKFFETTPISDQEQKYPDYYGGSYIDENGNLVVYVTDETAEQTIAVLAESLGNSTVYKECNYSFNELHSIMDTINNFMRNPTNKALATNIRQFCILDAQNIVEVKIRDISDEQIELFKKEIVDSDAIVFKKIKAEASTQLPPQDTAENNLAETTRASVSVNPGSKIMSYLLGDSYATAGYRVKDSVGNVGFVTAGHYPQFTGFGIITESKTDLGTCSILLYGNEQDSAFIKVYPEVTPTNTLNGTSNTLSTIISEPGAGTTINKNGAKTGATSGSIVSTSWSGYIDSYYYSDVVKASYNCDRGDSGAPVYSYVSSTGTRYTVGMHIGKNYDDGSGLYLKANQIARDMNVTRY